MDIEHLKIYQRIASFKRVHEATFSVLRKTFLCLYKNTESLLVSKQEAMADGIEDGFGGSPLVSESGA